ncbi:unnamed protein product [Adineta ricciae]|uniref:riboflavin kinase n=1 Tax=Adineta ricciae TaxID=249248 RepID=A0A814WEZ2_ADIRI|nr:unnamed protein product [Adineta ricciae]
MTSALPYFTRGTIVRGFGRGSKELGCPTGSETRRQVIDRHFYVCFQYLANLDEATVEKLPTSIDQGVYYGWAQLLTKTDSEVYKMVTSIGTNPFYNNTKKTIVSVAIVNLCLNLMNVVLGNTHDA